MTNSNNLMQKVINTAGFAAGGGLLKPEQSDRFIDYMWDASVLMPQVRTVKMNRDVQDIDKMNVGRRILRGASEAVDDGINVGPRFSKISLTASKFRADWELSRDVLEDNLEGPELENHIARLLTTQIGQDMEDLAINGDKDSSDPLLHHLDGWGVRGEAGGHIVTADDAEGKTVREVLGSMVRSMPRNYIGRRQNLRFFAPSNMLQRHVDEIGEAVAQAQLADPRAELAQENVLNGPVGYSVMGTNGIRLHEVPLMDDSFAAPDADQPTGDIWLTDPNNLIWGVRREVEVFSEFARKKDTIEYTVYTRVAAAVEETDAFVIAKDVSTAPVTTP